MTMLAKLETKHRNLTRTIKIEGRCFSCLTHQQLYPAAHPRNGERVYLCGRCKRPSNMIN